MAPEAPAVLLSYPDRHIAEVRLNHPERLNAVDEHTVEAMRSALRELSDRGDLRVVLLSGQGRAFCAGANYKRHASGTRTPKELQAYLDMLLDTCSQLRSFPLPIICVVQGYAVGIGLEMALNCDFVIMADSAEVGFPEVGIATFVGGGVTRILPQLVGLARARDMIMLGTRLTGPQAVAAGLVLCSVPEPSLREEALLLARRLAQAAPVPVRLAKKLLNSDVEMNAATLAEREAVLTCMTTEDWREGVRAFAEKRTPVYTGR